jgi:cytochrome c551/c552
LWQLGAYHSAVSSQPGACVDCHSGALPAANASTQSSWVYTLTLGSTSTNQAQWMNHGSSSVAGKDCVVCHAADAKASGSAWSKADYFHGPVAAPGSCKECHGLTNGGGSVAGTKNNLPVGLTNSSLLTTASANATTGIPAGTHDQITHTDVNVSARDCNFCHTQKGVSTAAGVQGQEWAQAGFHVKFTSANPLVMNGTTGRCSSCHMNVKPGATFTAFDHSTFSSATGSQDCSSCHSWPGTGTASSANWLGAGASPQYIPVGGFQVAQPPAATPTTQLGINNLPHPAVGTGVACTACHNSQAGGKNAIGYDHLSALINTNCSSCHEAGTNLIGTLWNGATAQASGAGDSRPYTLTSVVAQYKGNRLTVTYPKHFYPVDCSQCHVVPAGNGNVTTGAAYTAAWVFPHTERKMTNPSTCSMCHTKGIP